MSDAGGVGGVGGGDAGGMGGADGAGMGSDAGMGGADAAGFGAAMDSVGGMTSGPGVDAGAFTGMANPGSFAADATGLQGGLLSSTALTDPATLSTVGYSPTQPGFHDYTAGPNLVCPADLQCTPQEIADQLSRFAVPGQSPATPIQTNQINPVHDPETGVYVGSVLSTITDDGLTVQNVTQPGHIFYDGQITRTATQAPDGSWSVTTHGTGNNVYPGMSFANQQFGPGIFNGLDAAMRSNIAAHHGAR